MQNIPEHSFSIEHSEKDFFVVNKSPGVSMHSENGTPGLIEQMRNQLSLETLYPVHRLDKPTSGLLIVAKNKEATATLSRLFKDRKIEKTYLALSIKKPNKKMGAVIGDLAKARNGAWKLLRSKQNPAISQFTSYGLGVSEVSGKTLKLFYVKPKTGKTHQIRVAMKSLGSPILGDELYSGDASDRLYLHAYALRFSYLGDNKEFIVKPSPGREYASEALNSKLEEVGSPFELNWPKLKDSNIGKGI